MPSLIYKLSLLLWLFSSIAVAIEELLATRTVAARPNGGVPYSPDCVHFHLAAHYVNSQFAKRRIGFLGFDEYRESFITKDPSEAHLLHLGKHGTLRTQIYRVGSRELAARRGWGPLKLHHRAFLTKERAVWSIDGDTGHVHFASPDYTLKSSGEAAFCRSDEKKSKVLAQYDSRVPSSFKCREIYFVARCVNYIHPNPSDAPSPHSPRLGSREIDDEEQDELEGFKAVRRNVAV